MNYQQRFYLICLTEKMAVKSPFLGLGIAHIFCGLVAICTQIGILYLYDGDDYVYIGTGIWCGMTFIIAGILVLSSESPSVLTFRKVMVILSMVFAIFMAVWAFIASLIHARIDAIDENDQYSHEHSLRVTQGFCAIFEIVLTIVTLCQRTSDQEGQVLAQGPILTIQPGVQQGVQLQGVQSGVGYAPNTQVITYLPPQTSANPQNFVGISTNPPPYSQPAQNQQSNKS